MTLSMAQCVGVDISKDALDVALHPAGDTIRLANDAKGHRALIKRLRELKIVRVVFEATGAYHRRFERTLAEAGLPMVKVNPQPRPTLRRSRRKAGQDRSMRRPPARPHGRRARA